jgi:glycosyltransferase 2 family protein
MKQRTVSLPLVLRCLVGVAVLAFLIRRSDLQSLTIVWGARTVIGLLVATGIIAAAQVFSALRWRFLLGNEDGLPFTYLLRVYFIGFFFGLFLPTSVGGDAVRAATVSKGAKRPGWAISSVVLERALGLVAMMGLLLAGGMLAPDVFQFAVGKATFNLSISSTMIAIAAPVMLLVAYIGFRILKSSPRASKLIGDGLALWTSCLQRPGAFASAFGMSVVVQSAYLIAWYQLAVSLGLQVPFTSFLVFVPFVSIAAMLPVTISGIGLREGAWALLLASYGVGSADAVAFSLMYFVAFMVVGLFGGLVFAYFGLTRTAIQPAPAAVAPVLQATGTGA